MVTRIWIAALAAGALLASGMGLRAEDEKDSKKSKDERSSASERSDKESGDRKESERRDRAMRGTIGSISDGRLTLKLEDGKEKKFDLGDSSTIRVDGKRAKIEDLKEGDRVRITSDDGNFQTIRVTRNGSDDTAVGRRQPPADPTTPNAVLQPGQPEEQAQGQSQDQVANRPQLGVLLGPSPTTGARIHQIAPNSAAARAGLRPGDYILTVDDRQISSPEDVGQALDEADPSDGSYLTVWNNGQTRDVLVTFEQSQVTGFRGVDQPQAGRNQGDAARAAIPSPSNPSNPSNASQNRAWLGIAPADFGSQLQAGSNQNQNRGVFVRSVFPGSPAERAGIRNGDTITRFNGNEVSRAQDILDAMTELEPQKEIEIEVTRNGEAQSITATLEDRQQAFSQDGRSAFGAQQRNPNQQQQFQPQSGSAQPGQPRPDQARPDQPQRNQDESGQPRSDEPQQNRD